MAFSLEILILWFTWSAVILKTLMAEISLTASKKERWSVMIAFLLITSVAASHLIVPPIHRTYSRWRCKKIPCYFNTAFISQPGKSCSYVPVFKLAAYVMLCFHWVSCKYNNRMITIVWHNHCRGTNHTLPNGSSKNSDLVFVPASWLNLVLPKGGINFSKDNLQNSCTVICFYLLLQLHEGITLLLVNKKNAVGMMAPLLHHCKEHQLCHSSEFFVVAPFHLPLISFPNDTMLLRLMSQTIKIVK